MYNSYIISNTHTYEYELSLSFEIEIRIPQIYHYQCPKSIINIKIPDVNQRASELPVARPL